MAIIRLLLFVAAMLPLSLGAAVSKPLRVVALHPVLGEFAGRLGGEGVVVEQLLPSGGDPHSFSPRPVDIRRLAEADLVLANGFELEPWLRRLVQNSGTKGLVVEASSAIRERVASAEGCTHVSHKPEAHTCTEPGHDHGEAHEHAHEHGEFDPHWWHSPRAAADVARAMAASLQGLRAQDAGQIATRLNALVAELDELGRWALARVAPIEPAHRHLVTSHDAFGYLARDLGFTVHPLSGVNPDAEASARDLARLIDLVKKEGIKVIFTDSTENPRVIAAMVRGTGARVGASLMADGVAAEGVSYAAMYKANVEAIASALGDK